MQLGIVMTGYGALAAVNAGVMRALEERGLQPYAVCGLHAGAWPAALYLAGHGAGEMTLAAAQAARMGGRMLRPGRAKAMLCGKREALCGGQRLEHLLLAQAGAKTMALCARRGMTICRIAHTGRRVIFSTRDCAGDSGAAVCMQASVSFAARAAMSFPPFLAPQRWMGMELVADGDAAFASRMLMAMGAQRVLVVEPAVSLRRHMDALDLSCAAAEPGREKNLPEHALPLRIALDERFGALNIAQAVQIAQAGYDSAQRSLDCVLAAFGMAQCRVLPFRGPAANALHGC